MATGPKIIRYFLFAGFLIPCLLMVVISIGDVKIEGIWVWILLIPWPSFPLLMAADAGGGGFGELIAFMVAAAFNVLIYGVVGTLASFSYRKLFPRASL
jgi:hypothetical protein